MPETGEEMRVKDCPYHEWQVGCGLADNDFQNEIGIHIWCKKCKCRRDATFNRPCPIKSCQKQEKK
jgi:hypothetical protein